MSATDKSLVPHPRIAEILIAPEEVEALTTPTSILIACLNCYDCPGIADDDDPCPSDCCRCMWCVHVAYQITAAIRREQREARRLLSEALELLPAHTCASGECDMCRFSDGARTFLSGEGSDSMKGEK